jgi:hypothetical protein
MQGRRRRDVDMEDGVWNLYTIALRCLSVDVAWYPIELNH